MKAETMSEHDNERYMSMRCIIAYALNKKVTYTYCHYDGWGHPRLGVIEGVLRDHYTEPAKIDELIGMGGLIISEKVEKVEKQRLLTNDVSFVRDISDKDAAWTVSKSKFKAIASFDKFAFIYDPGLQVWHCVPTAGGYIDTVIELEKGE